MISLLQTIFFSVFVIFIIHQIYSFIIVPSPKIKFAAIEKYKSLLENIASTSIKSPSIPSNPDKTELLEVTDDIDDNVSIYSDGFTAIKNEMEDDLIKAVLYSS